MNKVNYRKIISNPDVQREIDISRAVEHLWGLLTRGEAKTGSGVDLAQETADLLEKWAKAIDVNVKWSPEGDPWQDNNAF